MANINQPILTNVSRIHRLRVEQLREIPNYPNGSAIGRPSGKFEAPEVWAFIYPGLKLDLPSAKFVRFVIEAQPLEPALDALAPISVQAATNHGVRIALEKVERDGAQVKWIPAERAGCTVAPGMINSIQLAPGERAVLIGTGFI